MRLYTSEQGTPEWFQDRAGVITGSMFHETRKRVNGLSEQQALYVTAICAGKSSAQARDIAGYKADPRADVVFRAIEGEAVGDFTDAAKEYAFKLAVERIGKTTLDADGFKGWQAERGSRLEEDCRLRHEADIGQIVDLAGFVTTDCGRFGCSADAFVGDEGGGEYKCFLAPAKLRPIIIENDWGVVADQVQGGMWVTERREWWDQCLYAPILAPVGLDFIRQRAYRDEKYIAELKSDLEEFDALVEEYKAQIITAAGSRSPAMPEPEPKFVFNF